MKNDTYVYITLCVCAKIEILIVSDAPDQFSTGFIAVNPNSKIPAAVDKTGGIDGKPVHLFESASIMVYLADK